MAEKKETPTKEEKPKADKPKTEEKKVTPKEEKKAAPKDIKKEEPKKADASTKDEEKPKKGEEKEEEKKFLKESIHTIPLRKAFDHPRTSRAKYAAREIKRYIVKHTRKEPQLDPALNELLWKRGIEKPPRKVKVKIQEEEKRATATPV